jgi:hypothetical protein
MPNAEYHAHEAVSRSFLWMLDSETPAHAIWRRQNPGEPTLSMRLGTALHAAVLEPDLFKREFSVSDASRRTTVGKSVHAAYAEQGLKILKQDDYDNVLKMAAAVHRHPLFPVFLGEGAAELSLFAMHPIWEVLIKCRPDWVTPEGIVVDVKTAVRAGPRAFRSAAYEHGYHLQAYMTQEVMRLRGMEPQGFVFFVVENDDPHATAVYYADEEMLRDGQEVYARAVETYSNCMKSGDWPAYPTELMPLTSPHWARMRKRETY